MIYESRIKVETFMLHDLTTRKGQGPEYFVEIQDIPRQVPTSVPGSWRWDLDTLYPFFHKICAKRVVHDDFGNLRPAD